MAMSMLFNTETLAKGERLQRRIISLTNTTVDMELSLNAHRNEKCGYKLDTDELASAKMEITQK